MKQLSKCLLRGLLGMAGLLTFTACYGPATGEWAEIVPESEPDQEQIEEYAPADAGDAAEDDIPEDGAAAES